MQPKDCLLLCEQSRVVYFNKHLCFVSLYRCEEHGQCKNGTCICMTGWNGRHCTLAGCPADCSGNGACVMENDEWVCRCESTWEGLDCSVKLETVCDDKKDNDNGQYFFFFPFESKKIPPLL